MCEALGRLEVAVQHEGIEVRTVGPHDGPQLVVHSNLRKEAGVGKWLKDGAMQLSREIDISPAAVAETDPQPVMSQHSCGRDRYEVHDPHFRQRVDQLRGAATLCADPVCFELVAVQTCRRVSTMGIWRTTSGGDPSSAAPAACCASRTSCRRPRRLSAGEVVATRCSTSCAPRAMLGRPHSQAQRESSSTTTRTVRSRRSLAPRTLPPSSSVRCT
jgi:hypothetical protein